MELVSFCKAVKSACSGISNQATFIKRMFMAAGFKGNYSNDHLKSVFNGNKPFSDKMKAEFPRPVIERSLAAFYEKYLKMDKINQLFLSFGIPASTPVNVPILSTVLARQLILFIGSETQDVADVVGSEYQQLLTDPHSTTVPIPLYAEDNAWPLTLKSTYVTDIYGWVDHTWIIQNTGKVFWSGRKLVFMNWDATKMRADDYAIPIPDTPPGTTVKLTTRISPHGFEGRKECIWEITDAGGHICFPGKSNMFRVVIDSKMVVS